MSEHEFKVGDRVRVVQPEDSFGNYEAGETAVVTNVDSLGNLDVKWDAEHPDSFYEAGRLNYLYPREVELIAEGAP